MRIRGFEKVSYLKEEINLPTSATEGSAGYDFYAYEDVTIEPINETYLDLAGNIKKEITPTLVKTGIKAYMEDGEFLQLCNRSSNPLKNLLVLANGVAVIDKDYYNNENNEGHIMFQFINIGKKDFIIKKGDKIGQGVFIPFLRADSGNSDEKRIGGFGSSGK